MSYFFKKRIFSLIFIISLFLYSGQNFVQNYPVLQKAVKTMAENRSFDKQTLDSKLESNVSERIGLVEIYGLAQRLMDKDEYNNFEYIKDKNGFLNYASFYRENMDDLFKCANRVKKLNDYVKPYGTKVMVVICPSKYDKHHSIYRTGLHANDRSLDTIELIVYLRRMGIEVLNLDEFMTDAVIPYEDRFFKTDHHWTVPAAFEATRIIVNEINNRFGNNLDPTGYYTGKDSYEKRTYYGHMLGSMGRGTGVIYSGTEDFEALFPKFEGKFTRTTLNRDNKRTVSSGSFEQALMETEVLRDDINIYEQSQYSLYINQVEDLEEIVNEENPDGPRIGMIRDSFFGPVIPFMAPMCSEIDAIYELRDAEELDITNYFKDKYKSGEGYDYIILEFYPSNLNEEAFKFFRGDE